MAKSPTINVGTTNAGLAIAKRAARAGAVIALVASLGGCASNLTGFEFPSFGLMSKFSNDEQANLSQPGPANSQSLSGAGGV